MRAYNSYDRSRNVFLSKKKKKRVRKNIEKNDIYNLYGYYMETETYNVSTGEFETLKKPYPKRIYKRPYARYWKKLCNKRVRHSVSYDEEDFPIVYNNGDYKKITEYWWIID